MNPNMSFRRRGYRMIGDVGAAERYERTRVRYMGDVGAGGGFGPLTYTAPRGTVTGEGQITPAPAAPAPTPKKTLNLHVAAPAAPAPAPVVTRAPAPVFQRASYSPVTAAVAPPATLDVTPVDTSDAGTGVIAATPECPSCTGKVAAGFFAGGLLMYLVGLLTREMDKKKKRKRR